MTKGFDEEELERLQHDSEMDESVSSIDEKSVNNNINHKIMPITPTPIRIDSNFVLPAKITKWQAD